MTLAVARYPKLAADFADVDAAIERFVIGEYLPPVAVFDAGSKILTQGSCFAENIAAALVEQGVSARHLGVLEAVNSPLANKLMFDYAINPEKKYAHPLHEHVFPRDVLAVVRTAMVESDVFILTMGLAYAYHDAAGVPTITADARHMDLVEQRYAGVEDNAKSVKFIVNALRRSNPRIKIVLTVSPVPLKTMLGGRGAVVCDVVSKATLRLAVEAVMALKMTNVFYWPAFEIVRALGMHTGLAFGADDGNPRHVNKELVGRIVRIFLKHFMAAAPQHSDSANP